MKEKLEQIRREAEERLKAQNVDLEELRIRFLGKKGELTSVLRGMGALTPEERPVIGQMANEVRAYIEKAIAEKGEELKKELLKSKLKKEIKICRQTIEEIERKRSRSQSALVQAVLLQEEPDEMDVEWFNKYTGEITACRNHMIELQKKLNSL